MKLYLVIDTISYNYCIEGIALNRQTAEELKNHLIATIDGADNNDYRIDEIIVNDDKATSFRDQNVDGQTIDNNLKEISVLRNERTQEIAAIASETGVLLDLKDVLKNSNDFLILDFVFDKENDLELVNGYEIVNDKLLRRRK